MYLELLQIDSKQYSAVIYPTIPSRMVSSWIYFPIIYLLLILKMTLNYSRGVCTKISYPH